MASSQISLEGRLQLSRRTKQMSRASSGGSFEEWTSRCHTVRASVRIPAEPGVVRKKTRSWQLAHRKSKISWCPVQGPLWHRNTKRHAKAPEQGVFQTLLNEQTVKSRGTHKLPVFIAVKWPKGIDSGICVSWRRKRKLFLQKLQNRVSPESRPCPLCPHNRIRCARQHRRQMCHKSVPDGEIHRPV